MVMQNIAALFGGSKSNGQAQQASSPRGYKSFVNVFAGDAAYDTMAEVFALIGAVGTWCKIWELTVPPQQLIRWGYGSPNQPYNQGYMWFFAGLAGTGFDTGTLRLAIARARDRDIKFVAELDDRRLHTATATTAITAQPLSINDMVSLPEKVEFPFIGQDSKLQLWYKADVLVAEDMVGFSIPVTRYEL